MSENNKMPKHWHSKKLGDVADYTNGRAFKPTEWEKNGVPIIRIQNLNNNGASFNYSNKEFEDRYRIEKGDLLYAWSASLGVYIWKGDKAWLNQHIFKVIPKSSCDKKFLFYSLEKITADLYAKTHGSGMVHVTKGKFVETIIPLPPLDEQQAIVSKIEELLSDLENGKQQLLTAQQQLKVYRQSLLKWAFEGKLTSDTEPVEVSGVLRKAPNRALRPVPNRALRQAQGTEPVAEPIPVAELVEATAAPSELPKGWKWVKLKELSLEISDGDHQPPPKAESGIPFITISNINRINNKIDFSDTFKVTREYYLKLKTNRKPKKGDVLYTVTGSYGVPVLIDFEEEFCFQRHIGLIRPLHSINQKWIFYLLQSPVVFNQAKKAATGTAQKTVALGSLRNFLIPYCSHHEQQAIVVELESKLTICDKIEEIINQSLLQAETLRQSILKRAFEGKLI